MSDIYHVKCEECGELNSIDPYDGDEDEEVFCGSCEEPLGPLDELDEVEVYSALKKEDLTQRVERRVEQTKHDDEERNRRYAQRCYNCTTPVPEGVEVIFLRDMLCETCSARPVKAPLKSADVEHEDVWVADQPQYGDDGKGD